MKVINKSRKIIGINGEPLLPGAEIELLAGQETHPVVKFYLEKGILAVSYTHLRAHDTPKKCDDISDLERAKIAEAAIAEYKAKQEAIVAAKAEKEAEIKAVKSMKKEELQLKAAALGMEVADDIKAEELKAQILDILTAELEQIG